MTIETHLETGIVGEGFFGRWMRATPAAWWIPTSVPGWSGAASTVFFNDRYLPRIPGVIGALVYIAIILLGGIRLGAITGMAMRRILAPGSRAELHNRCTAGLTRGIGALGSSKSL